MFDVSLSELMVIGVVALVVIGPERLPRVARTLGHLLGKLQRYVGQVKADINREMQLDDLKKFQEQMADEANKIKSSFTSVGDELRSVETSLRESVADGVPSAPTGEEVLPTRYAESGTEEIVAMASAPSAEPQLDADDWKLPQPLPEMSDSAIGSPAKTEKS